MSVPGTTPTAACRALAARARFAALATVARDPQGWPFATLVAVAFDAQAFLAIHPDAASYVSFADFGMWRIEVSQVRWVGGFGRMTWIDGAEYAGA
jgi:hypothetical protein